ncbi:MAG: hypothetical protein LBO09_05250 [Candidatus Peribacteria bacterium]|jgi:hypothetical protein|nr:hypothetical protein [Candidatus Peribacteria bacterium]
MAITKKTTSVATKKTTKPVKPLVVAKTTKPVKPLVVAKTTKPKVVVETKSFHPVVEESLPTCGCYNGKCKRAWKGLLKLLFALLTIANFVLLCVALSALKNQQNFTLLTNGGAENYETLKAIYNTPEYQSIMTAEIYKMVENINQTVAAQTPIQ